ncbi:hypothetical protein [Ectothiorhodospira variabilis]|uniref:hypothetical protein n=1 Tax=Ectothiorhodospira variabilis TaxID=505694 RepID=UPI001EFBC46B|nr:hypothetical protein [Ectothiorhodospira variabilis]MCG5498541.1 hypothetical protein [Ectothiorhodospira variabilis]
MILLIITAGSAVLAAAVLQISVQQHGGQARTYLAEQARYAALGRLAEAQEYIIKNGKCPATPDSRAFLDTGIKTRLSCRPLEGDEPFENQEPGIKVYDLEVTAYRFESLINAEIRRKVRAQIVVQD